MLGRFGTMFFAVLTLGSMAGCAQSAVAARAQADLHCTDEEIRVIEMADGYHGYGCGDHAVYQTWSQRHRRQELIRVD